MGWDRNLKFPSELFISICEAVNLWGTDQEVGSILKTGLRRMEDVIIDTSRAAKAKLPVTAHSLLPQTSPTMSAAQLKQGLIRIANMIPENVSEYKENIPLNGRDSRTGQVSDMGVQPRSRTPLGTRSSFQPEEDYRLVGRTPTKDRVEGTIDPAEFLNRTRQPKDLRRSSRPRPEPAPTKPEAPMAKPATPYFAPTIKKPEIVISRVGDAPSSTFYNNSTVKDPQGPSPAISPFRNTFPSPQPQPSQPQFSPSPFQQSQSWQQSQPPAQAQTAPLSSPSFHSFQGSSRPLQISVPPASSPRPQAPDSPEITGLGGLKSYDSREREAQVQTKLFVEATRGPRAEERGYTPGKSNPWADTEENAGKVFEAQNKTVVFVPYYQPTKEKQGEEGDEDTDGATDRLGNRGGESAENRRSLLGPQQSAVSKNSRKQAPVKLEVTTTKPIEIRMVGIEAPLSSWEQGGEAQGTGAGGLGSGQPKEPTDLEALANQSTGPLPTAAPGTLSPATSGRQAGFIRTLGVGREVLKVDWGNPDVERNLIKEYSPSKKSRLSKVETLDLGLSKIALASLDFRADNPFSRIVADTEGRLTGLSGSGVNVVQSADVASSQQYRDRINRVLVDRPSALLKVFSDGRVAYFDRMANSLHLHDINTGQDLRVIRGTAYTRDVHDRRVVLGYTPARDSVLWRRTETTLAVVHLTDFEVEKEIANFWPAVSPEVFSECQVVCDQNKNTFLGASRTKNHGTMISLHTGGARVRHVGLADLFKSAHYCSALCLLQAPDAAQPIAAAVLRVGLRSIIVSLRLTPNLAAISALPLTTEPEEDFFSIQRVGGISEGIYTLSSQKRILLMSASPTGLLTPLEHLCVFTTDPLVSTWNVSARPRIMILCKRSVSILDLLPADGADPFDDEIAKAEGRDRHKDSPSPPKEVQPISQTPVKFEAYEMPALKPVFKALPVENTSTDVAQRVVLPFDLGRVRRLATDATQERLFMAGESVAILAGMGGTFRLLDHRGSFAAFSLAALGAGTLLLSDSGSHDLIVANRDLKEVGRYKGVPPLAADDRPNQKYVQQSERGFLWLAGATRVCFVLPDLTIEDLRIFDALFVKQFSPIIRLALRTGQGRLLLAVNLGGKGECLVIAHEGLTQVTPINSIGGGVKTLDALCLDQDKGSILIGGSTHLDRESRQACAVFVIATAEGKPRASHTLTLDQATQTVSVIKVLRSGIYAVGCRGQIAILSLHPQTGLSIVRVLYHHPGMQVSDICVFRGSIFSVSETDDAVWVTPLDFLAQLEE